MALVAKGPVSKAHPFASQPVAAGPAKVGANSPKLDDETMGLALVTGAAAVPMETRTKPQAITTNKIEIENQPGLCLPLLAKLIRFSCVETKVGEVDLVGGVWRLSAAALYNRTKHSKIGFFRYSRPSFEPDKSDAANGGHCSSKRFKARELSGQVFGQKLSFPANVGIRGK
jgi:hypothetical protein